MTELSKYIGPNTDFPSMGDGVGPVEIGYLYGQYKRINSHCGQIGKGLLWGGYPVHQQVRRIFYDCSVVTFHTFPFVFLLGFLSF
jgi:glutamate dehydrogenase/leucine dehydrogenase